MWWSHSATGVWYLPCQRSVKSLSASSGSLPVMVARASVLVIKSVAKGLCGSVASSIGSGLCSYLSRTAGWTTTALTLSRRRLDAVARVAVMMPTMPGRCRSSTRAGTPPWILFAAPTKDRRPFTHGASESAVLQRAATWRDAQNGSARDHNSWASRDLLVVGPSEGTGHAVGVVQHHHHALNLLGDEVVQLDAARRVGQHLFGQPLQQVGTARVSGLLHRS